MKRLVAVAAALAALAGVTGAAARQAAVSNGDVSWELYDPAAIGPPGQVECWHYFPPPPKCEAPPPKSGGPR